MSLGKKTGIILIVFQIVIIICFAFVAKYGEEADSRSNVPSTSINIYYPMFQDVQVMIIIGFGMLMMFMKRYSYSGGGLNFLVSALTFQYGLLLQRIIEPLKLGMTNLIDADVTAAAVLISMGAVLGKTTPLQLLFIMILEVPVYIGNKYLSTVMKVADIGGSISVHTFGAYFGLAVARLLGKPKNTSLESTRYDSDLFSVVGTLFLWIFWPSFNGALSWEDGQERAVINTYLALLSSCVVAFAVSSLTNMDGNKFSMVHVQNATLAGGVAIGAVADVLLVPYAALLIGAIAGLVCSLGFVYLQPLLLKYLDLHDSCGVHNLHGMPSIIAGIVGSIIAAGASTSAYGPKLYLLYPARAPYPSTQELKDVQLQVASVLPGEMRSASKQAVYQILSLVFTFLIAVISGAITGLLLKIITPWLGGVKDEYTHDDKLIWTLPEDDNKNDKHSSQITTIHSHPLSAGVI